MLQEVDSLTTDELAMESLVGYSLAQYSSEMAGLVQILQNDEDPVLLNVHSEVEAC